MHTYSAPHTISLLSHLFVVAFSAHHPCNPKILLQQSKLPIGYVFVWTANQTCGITTLLILITCLNVIHDTIAPFLKYLNWHKLLCLTYGPVELIWIVICNLL